MGARDRLVSGRRACSALGRASVGTRTSTAVWVGRSLPPRSQRAVEHRHVDDLSIPSSIVALQRERQRCFKLFPATGLFAAPSMIGLSRSATRFRRSLPEHLLITSHLDFRQWVTKSGCSRWLISP